ncbi:MAG: chemotaxis protein CheD [Candidatus Omnitrophota bacterium]|nr:chemotaxis protein CheD [Candidatus Omnitrophota bacterium]
MNTEVPMGELVVIKEEGNLTCHAVGSCAVVALYDPKLKIAGIIHAMLPSSVPHHASRATDNGKYVDTAIDLVLEKMRSFGAQSFNINAKLVGGANMFNLSSSNIGMDNILSAKKKLKEEGIKLIGESIGGSIGRSVEFSAATGIVTVKIIF